MAVSKKDWSKPASDPVNRGGGGGMTQGQRAAAERYAASAAQYRPSTASGGVFGSPVSSSDPDADALQTISGIEDKLNDLAIRAAQRQRLRDSRRPGLRRWPRRGAQRCRAVSRASRNGWPLLGLACHPSNARRTGPPDRGGSRRRVYDAGRRRLWLLHIRAC